MPANIPPARSGHDSHEIPMKGMPWHDQDHRNHAPSHHENDRNHQTLHNESRIPY